MITYKTIKLFLLFLLMPFAVLAQTSVGTPDAGVEITKDGAATYNLSFEIPNGGGFEPKIGLAYSSQSMGYGNAGFGFNITGISAITSGGKDMYRDGQTKGNDGDYASSFYLDGKRLILVSGTSGYPDSKYQVEGDPNTEITLKGEINNVIISAWFEVRTADGSLYYYGHDKTSRLTFKEKSGQNRCSAWYISEAIDKYKNYIKYTYDQDNLCVYPRKIVYGKMSPYYSSNYKRQLSCWIDFEYTTITQNNQKLFYLGSSQGKIAKKLSTVKTMTNNNPDNQSSGSLYRQYTLSYSDGIDGGNKKYTRLTSIVESNGNGDKYSPITINWNGLPSFSVSTSNLSARTKTAGRTEKNKSFTTLDLNNDGISDVVRYTQYEKSKNEYYCSFDIALSEKSSTGAVSYKQLGEFNSGTYKFDNDGFKSGVRGFYAGDFDGDGYTDIVIPSYNNSTDKWYQYLYIVRGNETSKINKYSSYYTSSPSKTYDYKPIVATLDINGDGKMDLLSFSSVKKSGYYELDILSNGKWETTKLSMVLEPKSLYVNDYNNDGLADLMFISEKGYMVYFNNGYKGDVKNVFTYANSKYVLEKSNQECLKEHWKINQGDFNGDGLVDFVYIKIDDTHLWLAYNNGDGTFTYKQSYNLSTKDHPATEDNNKFSINVCDVNCDGLSDIIVCKAEYKYNGNIRACFGDPYDYKHTRFIWLCSTGSSFECKRDFKKNRAEDAIEGYVFPGDFDGDGNIELANYGSLLSNTSSTAFSENTINIYKGASNVASMGKVSKITDGLGLVTTIKYDIATNPTICKNSVKGTYPVFTYNCPVSVVSEITTSGKSVSSNTTQFTYGDYKVHVGGRGALGFSSFTKKNVETGITENTTVNSWDSGYRVQTKVTNTTTLPDNKTKSTTISNIAVAELGNALSGKVNKYFAYPSSTTVTDYDGNVTTTTCTYDTSKGVMTYQKVSDDGGKMYKEEAYTYSTQKICGAWLPTQKKSTQKHSDSNTTYSIVENYTYDSFGNPTKVVMTPNGATSLQLTSTYTYDHFGNKKSELTTGTNVKPITKLYYYDSTYRFVASEKATSSSLVASHIAYKYNIFGDLLEEIDSTATSNVLKTTYLYNGWNEVTKKTSPDKNYTTYAKAWDASVGYGIYSITMTPNNGSAKKTIYDALGREVYTSTTGIGGVAVSKTMYYSNKGYIAATISNTGSRSMTETTEYDSRGRLTGSRLSSGKSTAYSYGNRTVSITTANGTTKKTYDAWGNVKGILDPSDTYVEYKYNSSGNPSTIVTYTNSGNNSQVTLGYDAAGHRTSMTDPDAGTTTTKYAADGTVLSQTDARGVTTNYTYDALGRVTTKTYVDKSGKKNTQTNEYFTSGKDVNRLKAQTFDGKKRTFTYDAYGRILTETRYVHHYLAGNTTYTTKWTYNTLGQMTRVAYPGTIGDIIFDYSYDSNGFVKEIKQGSQSVYSLRGYDGLTLETNTVAGVMKKTVDKDGYPSQYQLTVGSTVKDLQTFTYNKSTDNLLTRYWKHGSSVLVNEAFDYDNMDRLVSVSNNSTKVKTMAMSYADNGNILSKSDVGTYSYDQENKPHAVISVSNDSKNIKSNTVATEIDPNGKIGSIGTDGAFMSYVYGPDDEKWMTGSWNPDQVCENDIEHLYFGNYERVIEDDIITEYYYIDNGVVLISKTVGTEDPNWNVYQTVTDNLGSIIAVYDEYKQEVFRAKYDAWGKQTVYTNKINFQYGYTGHEMLPYYGLIDMNARLYDPTLGRFLSCDNYVQEPNNSQNFNRYSYCVNNPLKFTDPSGNSFILAGAIIGAVMGGINAALKHDNIIGGILIGGAVGALSSWAGGAMAGLTQANNVWAGSISGAVAGVGTGAATTFVSTTMNNLVNGRCWNEGLSSVWSSALTGAITGALSGGFKAYKFCRENKLNPWGRTSKISFYRNEGPNWEQPNKKAYCWKYANAKADRMLGGSKVPDDFYVDTFDNPSFRDGWNPKESWLINDWNTDTWVYDNGFYDGTDLYNYSQRFASGTIATEVARTGHVMTMVGFDVTVTNDWWGKLSTDYHLVGMTVYDSLNKAELGGLIHSMDVKKIVQFTDVMRDSYAPIKSWVHYRH